MQLSAIGLSLRRWGKAHRIELLLVIALLLSAVVVRLDSVQMLETGGDVTNKWWFARNAIQGDLPEKWNHHDTRMSINLLAMAQLLVSENPAYFFIIPGLMSLLVVLFVYLITRELAGPVAGAAAGILVIIFPASERAGAQLLPGIFSAAYLSAAVWALLRYARSERHAVMWLVTSAFATFLAWLAHTANALFFPGIFLAVFLARRSWRDLMVYSGVLIGFFLLETAWYALFTEHASRLHITTGTHPGSRRGREFWELFRRYKIAPWHWQLAIFSSVPAALGLFGFGKHQSRLLALVTSAYLVVLTFHHRPFEYPFHPYLPDHARYFYAATPLLIASVVTFFATALRAWMAQSFERLPQRLVRPAAAIGRHPALVALGCTVLFGSYAWINSKSPLRPKAMQEVIEYRSIALKAYRSGVPIVATNRHWKAVDIIRKLFLPRDAILNADGSLDPPKRLKTGKYTYLLSSGPADRAVERAIRSGRCSVQFTRRRTGHGGTQLRLVKARYEPHCLDKFRTKIRAAAKD